MENPEEKAHPRKKLLVRAAKVLTVFRVKTKMLIFATIFGYARYR
jgi:hypothetical protein